MFFLNKKRGRKIKKTLKNVKKHDLNKKRKKTFITSMPWSDWKTITLRLISVHVSIVEKK